MAETGKVLGNMKYVKTGLVDPLSFNWCLGMFSKLIETQDYSNDRFVCFLRELLRVLLIYSRK